MKSTKISVLSFLLVASSLVTKAQENVPEVISVPIVNVTSFPDLANYTLPTANRNYVRTYLPAKPTTSSSAIMMGNQNVVPCITTAAYFDGLGRPLQEVFCSGSNNQNSDVVTVHAYDALGRESYNYLPYTVNDIINTSHGRLKKTPLDGLSGLYNLIFPGQQPYGKTEYDGSPLNRVTKTFAPGLAWIGSERAKEYTYRTNRADEDVQIWSIGSNAGDLPVSSGAYNDGELSVTEVRDEDGHISIEYKDKEGHLVLSKKFLISIHGGGPHMQYACIYNVYDDLNHLRYIITPNAVGQILSNWDVSAVTGLCFRYVYDERGRVIEKQLPDKDAEFMVYDSRDRLVLGQDGNMRANGDNKWAFTGYDVLDRPLATGIYNASGAETQQSLAAILASTTAVYNGGNALYYLLKSRSAYNYPATLSDGEFYTYNYYDDYALLPSATFNASYNSMLTGAAAYCEMPVASTQTRGLLTGTKVKVLDLINNNLWITTINFYSNKGQLIQQQGNNHLGGDEVTTIQYDFQGTPLSTVLHHTNPQATTPYGTTNIVKRLTKNYVTGTITKEEQNINTTGFRNISSSSYDVLGRLTTKSLGTVATNSYVYNIRGWLTGINGPGVEDYNNKEFFHELLCYEGGFTNTCLTAMSQASNGAAMEHNRYSASMVTNMIIWIA